MMFRKPDRVEIDVIPKDDLDRINKLLWMAGGSTVSWGAQSTLDVWLTEKRMEADREASHRVEFATWALVLVTLVLALATVGLIVATLRG